VTSTAPAIARVAWRSARLPARRFIAFYLLNGDQPPIQPIH
jgi:hypothetical protein